MQRCTGIKEAFLTANTVRMYSEKMKTKFVYTGIRVSNLEKSIDFYTKILGMHVKSRQKIKEASGEVVSMACSPEGPELELNYYDRGSMFDAPYTVGEGLDHLAFSVDDLDAAVEECTKAGHPVVQEIRTERSRWVYVRDPDGNYIELFVSSS